MGNPFAEDNGDLLVLDTRDIADPAIVETVRVIEKTGQEQYEKYMTERVIKRTTPLSDPISRNKMPLFSRPPARVPSKAKQIVSSLKSDCVLFSRLYIACQTRDGDLDNWVLRRHVHSLYSMPSQVAIRCRHLQAGEKRLHLTHGNLSMMLPQYSLPCRHIHRASMKTACLC